MIGSESLTGPIVEAALAPVLKQLGDNTTPAQILNLKVCDPAMGSGAFLVEACRQLGAALSRAWHVHNERPILPLDEDEELHAQRQIAQRCLYGVDKNPMATDLAKLSLWLATLAKDHPFTFLDHSLRAGDSLVGLTRKQIAAFNWNPTAQMSLLEQRIRKTIETVSNYRQQIFAARDDVPYTQLKQKLDAAEDALNLPRQIGNAVVAAFFAGEKPKDRENIRTRLSDTVTSDLRNHGFVAVDGVIDQAIAKLKAGARGIHPFHWELEFPEVFSVDERGKQTGGFDVIIGNPPFAGRDTTIAANQRNFPDWLKAVHADSHGNADLVAHFFRHAFDLLRPDGCMGLIATNTISQGDTRSTGLRWICNHGGTIYRAKKRLKWPGEAAVVVSVIHIYRGALSAPYLLDGRAAARISAYLFHAGGNEDPARIAANSGKSFKGSMILGMGFTFDDTDTNGVASSIAEMRCLIEKDPRNRDRIFPFLGGEEINNSPTHTHHRYIINFEDFPLERMTTGKSWFRLTEETQRQQRQGGVVAPDYPGPVAADWPDLISIVRKRVKPERDRDNREVRRRFWWRYGENTPGLNAAKASLDRVFAISCVSPWLAFGEIDSRVVASHAAVVVADESPSTFATIQSRPHEVWTLFMASSLEDRLRYTPSDCFETFPFPEDYETNEHLKAAGRKYYDFRSDLMIRNDEGLTKTYNRFHDPNEDSAGIQRLRELHATMDRVVLDAYGWQDIQPVCDFFPEFDDEEEEEDGGRPKKKKYRYRWPEDIHDEVLARLLDLNRQRALEEGQILVPEQPTDSPWADESLKVAKKSSRKNKVAGSPGPLFSTTEEEA